VSFEIALSIAAGLALAAACGFRVFTPLLVMSLAARAGHLDLASGFDWIASTPALVALATATGLEILAYYVPWVDNLLDTVATPAAVVAGMIVAGSQIADIAPWLRWTTAIIGGGGMAAGVQGATVLARQLSSFATGGVANPLVSTAEMGASLSLSVMAIVAAPLALLVLAAGLFMILRRVLRARSAASVAGS